ncbi:hypothetical protein ACMZ4X_01696 [Achromobacter marplatensis]
MPNSSTTPQRSAAGQSGGPSTSTGEQTREPSAADPQGYEHPHSGRRAAGHGGGALDRDREDAGNPGEPAAAHSGGGSGHASQASQQREAEEELESRNGPHVRGGSAERDTAHADQKGRPRGGSR